MSLAGVLQPLLLLLLLLLLVSASPPPCHGASSHNITDILAAHPEFSDFSAALSRTGAAAEIDRRQTITVLAVDNAAMAAAQRLQPEDLKRVIALHVLLDYFDDDKLVSLQAGFARATSLFQTSGNAAGSGGIVNITIRQGGRVAFTAEPAASGTSPVAVFYEKSIQKSPYDIAVLQVDALISSPAARSNSSQGRTAPAQAPSTPAPAAPATAPATPASAPVAAPATAPVTAAPAPVAAPATAPSAPRRRPAPEPESAPAPSPDADDKPPADQKNNGARGTASWTLVAVALPAAIVLVL